LKFFFLQDKVTNNNDADRLLQNECHCRNGGVCVTSPTGGKLCQCFNGFTGSFCESSICKFYEIIQ